MSPRSLGHLRLAIVAGATLVAAGCALRAGKEATESSLQAVRESQQSYGDIQKEASPSEVAGERLIKGSAEELGSPETQRQLSRAADVIVGQAVRNLQRAFGGGSGPLARELELEARALGREASAGLLDELFTVRAFVAVAALCAAGALSVLLVRSAWRVLLPDHRPRPRGREARA